jgi:ATP-binding cassette subfamily F protein 3
LPPGQARSLLGTFLFTGEEAEKELAVLSGGERQRAQLAILVACGANVLILDEPTNHLDLESREALEDALLAFQGALLLVSHDRALLDAVGRRTVAIEDYTLRSYVGGYPEYVRVRAERETLGIKPPPMPPPTPDYKPGGAVNRDARGPDGRALYQSAPEDSRAASQRRHGADEQPNVGTTEGRAPGAVGQAPQSKTQTSRGARTASQKGPSKNRLRKQAQLEQAVEDAESALASLEEELSQPMAWATAYESAKSTARHTAAKRAVETAYAELEEFELGAAPQ